MSYLVYFVRRRHCCGVRRARNIIVSPQASRLSAGVTVQGLESSLARLHSGVRIPANWLEGRGDTKSEDRTKVQYLCPTSRNEMSREINLEAINDLYRFDSRRMATPVHRPF